MSNVDVIAETHCLVDDPLASFAHEAERSLSALYRSVCASYGEKIAFFVAERWLALFEKRLAVCNELPEIGEIAAFAIAAFLVPATREKPLSEWT